MVHGSCASAGCYAMTDPVIDEFWALVTAALNAGQERVAVHVFPFRMTEERMAAFAWHPSAEFWRDLKPAYDLFEETHVPPQVSVCNKRYAVKRGNAAATAPAAPVRLARRARTMAGRLFRRAMSAAPAQSVEIRLRSARAPTPSPLRGG